MTVAFRVVITSSLKEGSSGDDFRAFAGRAGAAVAANEPGTTVYNWWLGEDGTVVNEDGYADEASFGAHMGNMTESGMLEEFMGMLDIRSVQVLGDVSEPTREAMAAFGPVHYTRVFER